MPRHPGDAPGAAAGYHECGCRPQRPQYCQEQGVLLRGSCDDCGPTRNRSPAPLGALGVEAGREPMLRIYPPQPAKQWATFAIESYEEYEKPGKYGDEKTEKFAFVPDEQPDWAELVASLAAGDRVKIAWLHEYVTREEPGEGDNEGKTFTSKYPERIVTQLEKL